MPRGKEPTSGRLVPGPFAQLPYKLLGDTNVSSNAKIIYLALRHNAMSLTTSEVPEGRYLSVIIDRTYLLQDTGLTRETFRRGLAELERQGWVLVVRANEDEASVNRNGHKYTLRVERDRFGPSTYILLAG